MNFAGNREQVATGQGCDVRLVGIRRSENGLGASSCPTRCEVEMEIPRVRCEQCDGTGRSARTTCERCHGYGYYIPTKSKNSSRDLNDQEPPRGGAANKCAS
jgi:hypothetical protein